MKLHMEMNLGDLLDRWPEAERVLAGLGMFCTGCPAARGESLAEACAIHGIDPAELLRRLETERDGASH